MEGGFVQGAGRRSPAREPAPNLYGTPEDVAKVNEAFLRGQRAALTSGGFFEIAGEKTLATIDGAKELVGTLLARLGGERPSHGGQKPEIAAGKPENGASAEPHSPIAGT